MDLIFAIAVAIWFYRSAKKAGRPPIRFALASFFVIEVAYWVLFFSFEPTVRNMGPGLIGAFIIATSSIVLAVVWFVQRQLFGVARVGAAEHKTPPAPAGDGSKGDK